MVDECECSDLEELKKAYVEIQKKYGLPEFDRLNKDFQVEKIAEVETDYLVREIRKFIADKFSNYLRFIETILNPVNAQMIVFHIIKMLGAEEKTKLTDVYKKLSKFEVQLISLDVDFNEQKEVEFIKDSCAVWDEVKKDILEVMNVVNKKWDDKIEKNGKGYFG